MIATIAGKKGSVIEAITWKPLLGDRSSLCGPTYKGEGGGKLNSSAKCEESAAKRDRCYLERDPSQIPTIALRARI